MSLTWFLMTSEALMRIITSPLGWTGKVVSSLMLRSAVPVPGTTATGVLSDISDWNESEIAQGIPRRKATEAASASRLRNNDRDGREDAGRASTTGASSTIG